MAIEKISVGLDFGNGHKREVGTLAFYEKNAFDPRGNRQKVIGFEYAEAFLNNPLPISPFYLPVKGGELGPFEDGGLDGLPGVFSDSLPGGWGWKLFESWMDEKGINPYQLTVLERLSYVGKRGMGALVYQPDHSEADKNAGKLIDLSRWSKNAEQFLEGTYSVKQLEELIRGAASSEGMRPKAMIGISHYEKNSIYGTEELPEGYDAWMVKSPSAGDGQDAGIVEYVYSQMAREAGVEMPPTFCVPLKKDNIDESLTYKALFMVKRFDREGKKRFHMHSAAGLLHKKGREMGGASDLDYEELLKATEALTKNPNDVEKLYRMAVFNVLAHNRDDHAKNFSFLMDETGQWRVSPVYDLTFSHGPGGHQSMSVMGQSQSPKEEDLIKLGQHFHLSDMVIKEIIGRTKEALLKWPELGGKYGVQAKKIKEISDKISAKN